MLGTVSVTRSKLSAHFYLEERKQKCWERLNRSTRPVGPLRHWKSSETMFTGMPPSRAQNESRLLNSLPEPGDSDSALLFVTADDAWLLQQMGIFVDDFLLPVLKLWPETLA